MSQGPPAADDVDKTQWQSPTPYRLFADVDTCASSNCSLYTTNGMRPTGFKSIDTNRCAFNFTGVTLNNGVLTGGDSTSSGTVNGTGCQANGSGRVNEEGGAQQTTPTATRVPAQKRLNLSDLYTCISKFAWVIHSFQRN
ncbi:hypothetical protein AVEN_96823-1 [Araneus ventricosus]|uniref:Uncharacterized protein n=1 Tax=Araneus ventricosus TaxID=182803 RepID=A0A4Y2L6T5_ARAVE|nr:hypothetical protein AVEN_96823-1 [Araneus ventricosus]